MERFGKKCEASTLSRHVKNGVSPSTTEGKTPLYGFRKVDGRAVCRSFATRRRLAVEWLEVDSEVCLSLTRIIRLAWSDDIPKVSTIRRT